MSWYGNLYWRMIGELFCVFCLVPQNILRNLRRNETYWEPNLRRFIGQCCPKFLMPSSTLGVSNDQNRIRHAVHDIFMTFGMRSMTHRLNQTFQATNFIFISLNNNHQVSLVLKHPIIHCYKTK